MAGAGGRDVGAGFGGTDSGFGSGTRLGTLGQAGFRAVTGTGIVTGFLGAGAVTGMGMGTGFGGGTGMGMGVGICLGPGTGTGKHGEAVSSDRGAYVGGESLGVSLPFANGMLAMLERRGGLVLIFSGVGRTGRARAFPDSSLLVLRSTE